MAQASDIREHMAVRDAAGAFVGTVDAVEGDRIRLTRSGTPDGRHHHLPLSAVARVDAEVHLAQTAAALGLPVAGAPSAPSTVATRGNSVLPWIVGVVGLLLVLLVFKSFAGEERDPAPQAAAQAAMTGAGGTVAAGGPDAAVAPRGVSQLDDYLAAAQPLPGVFVFEQLAFDAGASTIPLQGGDELDRVAGVLKRYPDAHVRIATYPDASPADAKLGQARADSVKAALAARGVVAGRIDTAAAREGAGRATELVVVTR